MKPMGVVRILTLAGCASAAGGTVAAASADLRAAQLAYASGSITETDENAEISPVDKKREKAGARADSSLQTKKQHNKQLQQPPQLQRMQQ